MELADLKIKSEKELKELLGEQKHDLHALRFQAQSGQLKQVHKIDVIKKTVARITMLLRQKSAVKK